MKVRAARIRVARYRVSVVTWFCAETGPTSVVGQGGADRHAHVLLFF